MDTRKDPTGLTMDGWHWQISTCNQSLVSLVLLMLPEIFPHTHAHAWGRPVCRKSRSRKEKEHDMHAIRREGEDPAARPA